MNPSSNPSKLGIICGQGDLPSRVISRCLEVGRPFFLIGFEGQSPISLLHQYDHAWSQLGQVRKTLDFLRSAGVEELVFVGHFKRPSWRELKLDSLGLKWVSSMMGAVFGDDSLLKTIIHRLEREEGFRVVSAESIVGPSLLLNPGVHTKLSPDASSMSDIYHAIRVLKVLGEADVGQSLVIQDGLILSVEAIEGTDNLIRRSKELIRARGMPPILVKSVKPNQERRIDRPTIGPETIERLSESGFQGLAVGANEVIVLHPEILFDRANQLGLFVISVEDPHETK